MNTDLIITYNILTFICIMMSAFFSGSETSLVSSNYILIQNLHERGNMRAGIAMRILENQEDALRMILIGNNIANITATAFITYLATKAYLLEETGLLIVTVVQTLVFLVLCEITPKIVARSKAESYLLLFVHLLSFFFFFLRPLLKLSLLFPNLLTRRLKIEKSSTSIISSRDEIDVMFRLGHKEGIIDDKHHFFVNEILSFNKIKAREVMTPLIDVVSIEKKQGIRQLVKSIEKTRFSRIPVYEDRVDNIIGYVLYKDLLKKSTVQSIDEILRQPYFVPNTKRIYELLSEMREVEKPLVFVVNEHGAVEGLLTDEDIAEEIVGEIQTRDHPEEELIRETSPGRYIIQGDLDIEFFQRKFGIDIIKVDFETVAGFVISKMGKIPREGDKFEHDGFVFQVNEATDRSVEKVLLMRPARKKS
ncbi:MAG: hemolysin family protein [Spirochaetota bacterium]